MIVAKFGGTSVGSAPAIERLAEIVRGLDEPVVVVSAVSGVTDLLIEAARNAVRGEIDLRGLINRHQEIIRQLGVRPAGIEQLFEQLDRALRHIAELGVLGAGAADQVVSFGERLSARIVAATLERDGLEARPVDAWDAGIVTRPEGGEVLPEAQELIPRFFGKQGQVCVVTGFIAKDSQGRITNLGRGGSDYTAAILAAALGVQTLQIWTDVCGFRAVDPRIIEGARRIDRLTFDEAAELAYFGAKILHPKTIRPAREVGIPVEVLNSFSPDKPGTRIAVERDDVVHGRVRSVTSKKGVRVITVSSSRMLDAFGFLEQLFAVFARHGVVVDVVATSEVSVSATVDHDQPLDGLIEDLAGFARVQVEEDKAIICAVGEGLRANSAGVASRIFSLLDENEIQVRMISQGASSLNITFVIDEPQVEQTVRLLHGRFFE